MTGYSELSQPIYINQCATNDGNACQTSGGYNCQCTWYAMDRIQQLTGRRLGAEYGAWGDGSGWASTARTHNFPVYNTVEEALNAKGTLAGYGISTENGCLNGSCNHIAICEGYDPATKVIYVSEMLGSYGPACQVYLAEYQYSQYVNCSWIDFSMDASGGRGGYFKDKFGEFHWPEKPAKDVRFPTSSEYQEFCDRLNEAQEEAAVENPTEFSSTQDNNVLTADRFNEYLHLMQESTEGTLRGVDDEVEKMEDVKRDDIIYAKHFLQLEDLYNHWMYGSLQTGTDVPMNGSYAERIWDYLRSLGYSEMGAAGIIGNIVHECGSNDLNLINPSAVNYLGCYGLVQWCPYPYSDHFNLGGMYVGMSFEDQLRYLGTNSYGSIENIISKSYVNGGLRSCGTSAYNELKNSTSVYEATRIFFNCYEGAGDSSLGTRQTLAYQAYAAFNGRPLWTPSTGGGTASGNWILPLSGWYGQANCRSGDTNNAGDYPAPFNTPVVAADGGTVIQSQVWNGYTTCYPSNSLQTYGNSVLIDHGNGWTTRYAHFISAPLVSYGQAVSQGQILGYVGSTGCSSGAHLHFEMVYNGVGYCPNYYI